ncbi:succinate dehydrogenase / fumarate reductase flavoprotein subunit/fumarate reductase flavoprotein subunit [Desulfofundulus luciae]|uniref:Succinate dehydrogenase / fumarate reductase flavoprotein subunit/fumarate reductase flavoprotein subunit n=1 Tax=Desulfofundulus luciae TaxID=74702 RepID=A0ABU0B0D9_9FIRM|nr:FAD-binding protein [Desulfofundulus luciae]MDQ0286181.1 succinate dehydrogenase / fumarate reductase flavoprotein subunit/fumarate reductase flavoprotein subunit [Desulfofundulus luciae]
MEEIKADILILGSGGAGLFAALHAYDSNPRLKIVLATKGLIGKCGCSRMVQGGYNVVLDPKDSVELHFKDTIKGGAFINNQELAWTLVNDAPKRIHEMETKIGCFFDRREDGRIHQKPFAGQSFDRTVHRGDLTGIEIIARATDQVFARDITVLEETRGLELLTNSNGDRVVGALLMNIRTGQFIVVNAKAVIVATGGSASMYKISAPSFDKTGDGMAMCWRAGAEFVDMEMLQFHPTGLLAGKSRLSGSVLEEGLRGAGGRLYNAIGERFMERYDPERLERSTRDRVARAGYMEIMAGRGTPAGGVLLDMSHLGAEFVESKFPGMCERVRDIGKDLAREPVEVSPTAHFQMGGVRIDVNCYSSLKGLFVAGEDAGGVHGANRLGGNGIADSTVFGARAGDAAAEFAQSQNWVPVDQVQVKMFTNNVLKFFGHADGPDVYQLRDELKNLMWEKVGVVRTGQKLEQALKRLAEMSEEVERAKLPTGSLRGYNLALNEILNLRNQLVVAQLVAASALYRKESRGSHYREDFPETDNQNWLCNIFMRKKGDGYFIETRPVKLTRLRPEDVVAK